MMTKKDVAKQWLRKGNNDLLNARNTLATMGEDCPHDTVCFHAQQAAEKNLKGLLSFLEIEFFKTHDIGELIQLLPAGRRPRVSVVEQRKLSDYAVFARYPAAGEEPLREDAVGALEVAETITKWVQGQISRKSRK